jgi:hypothetical protein
MDEQRYRPTPGAPAHATHLRPAGRHGRRDHRGLRAAPRQLTDLHKNFSGRARILLARFVWFVATRYTPSAVFQDVTTRPQRRAAGRDAFGALPPQIV